MGGRAFLCFDRRETVDVVWRTNFLFLLRWYAMRHKVYMHVKTRLVEERKEKPSNVKETSTEWRTNMSPPADVSFGIANL